MSHLLRLRLDYGRTGLEVALPADRVVRVLEHSAAPPVPHPEQAVTDALRRPIASRSLADGAAGKRSACILVCDITRPVPNEVILTPLLDELAAAGISRDRVLLLIATGLHRPSTPEEIRAMVGRPIAERYRIENHDGKDLGAHRYLGDSPGGVPAYIDRRYLDADLKIATGLIEPHFMAGYSGGRKVICPGIAALPTVRAWHSPRFLEHPNAAAGVIEGNPVHEENTAIALMAGCDFIVNVCLDGQRRLTQVVAGDMVQAWEAGVAHCRRVARATLAEPVEIVVTSSAGYPLDATFYQAVKGMVGALPIVRPGGTIVIAARMEEGVGSPEFHRLLETTTSLEAFLLRIRHGDHFVMDQWQLEELAKAVRQCRVRVVTEGLAAEQLKRYFVEPAPSVEEAVAEALDTYGPNARIAVIPSGPYVLPQVA